MYTCVSVWMVEQYLKTLQTCISYSFFVKLGILIGGRMEAVNRDSFVSNVVVCISVHPYHMNIVELLCWILSKSNLAKQWVLFGEWSLLKYSSYLGCLYDYSSIHPHLCGNMMDCIVHSVFTNLSCWLFMCVCVCPYVFPPVKTWKACILLPLSVRRGMESFHIVRVNPFQN